MKGSADTSREALAELQPALAEKASRVVDSLNSYRTHHRIDPTSYELLQWMRIENPALDLNSVRPRLTELKDAGRVLTSGKRVCAVTLKRAYTWAAAPAREPASKAETRIAVAQEMLF